MLFGLIMFKPPFLQRDIGHYTAAIRINNKWEVFDDMRSQSYSTSPNQSAVIHCIFYIKSGASGSIPDQRSGLSILHEDTQNDEHKSSTSFNDKIEDAQHNVIHSPQPHVDMHCQEPDDDNYISGESTLVRHFLSYLRKKFTKAIFL